MTCWSSSRARDPSAKSQFEAVRNTVIDLQARRRRCRHRLNVLGASQALIPPATRAGSVALTDLPDDPEAYAQVLDALKSTICVKGGHAVPDDGQLTLMVHVSTEKRWREK